MTTDHGLVPLKMEGGLITYDDDEAISNTPKLYNWLDLNDIEMKRNQDCIDNIVRANGDTGGQFTRGYGGIYAAKWTVWTEDYVYLPSIFDGRPSVISAPREPSDFVYSIDELGG